MRRSQCLRDGRPPRYDERNERTRAAAQNPSIRHNASSLGVGLISKIVCRSDPHCYDYPAHRPMGNSVRRSVGTIIVAGQCGLAAVRVKPRAVNR
jgi:hypothetical protein